MVVKNNQLCATSETTSSSGGQRCGSRGCLTCPTIVQDNEGLCVNGRILSPGIQLNCKSSNVIYLAQCTICDPVQDNGDINLSIKELRGPGGLHQNFLEIDFIVVSDGGGVICIKCFWSHRKILFLAEIIAGQRSALMSNFIARLIFNRVP